jgi:nicotinamidase-related amidase
MAERPEGLVEMTELNKLVLPPGFTPAAVASHAPLVYTPEFWDPSKAYADYSPDIEGAFIEGVAYRQRNKLATAAELESKGVSNAMMLTDLQHDFRDGGRLPVLGTDTVVLRSCVRLLNGSVTDFYTKYIYSQDGHVPWHISYATRWRMMDGTPFDLRQNKAAMLDLVDRNRGIFRATCFDPTNGAAIDMGFIQSVLNIKDSVAYWDHMQGDPAKPETHQGPIWVFANHCKLGTDGVNLHPLLAETLAFIEGARLVAPVPVNKGQIRDTDWWGPLEPCRPDPNHPQGGFQKNIVDLFSKVKGRVEFVGVAEDFCDFNMKRQTLKYFEGTRFFEQMAFMIDGTAPIVPDAPQVTRQNEAAKRKGVRFFVHSEGFAHAA